MHSTSTTVTLNRFCLAELANEEGANFLSYLCCICLNVICWCKHFYEILSCVNWEAEICKSVVNADDDVQVTSKCIQVSFN